MLGCSNCTTTTVVIEPCALTPVPLSIAVFGTITVSAQSPKKRTPPAGIIVSEHRPNIGWRSVASKGFSFAYIGGTWGDRERYGTRIVRNVDISFQTAMIPNSLRNTTAPPTPVSSVVLTTSHSPGCPLAQNGPIALSPPPVETGLAMISRFRMLSGQMVMASIRQLMSIIRPSDFPYVPDRYGFERPRPS
jgi:hypothetical protein